MSPCPPPEWVGSFCSRHVPCTRLKASTSSVLAATLGTISEIFAKVDLTWPCCAPPNAGPCEPGKHGTGGEATRSPKTRWPEPPGRGNWGLTTPSSRWWTSGVRVPQFALPLLPPPMVSPSLHHPASRLAWVYFCFTPGGNRFPRRNNNPPRAPHGVRNWISLPGVMLAPGKLDPPSRANYGSSFHGLRRPPSRVGVSSAVEMCSSSNPSFDWVPRSREQWRKTKAPKAVASDSPSPLSVSIWNFEENLRTFSLSVVALTPPT